MLSNRTIYLQPHPTVNPTTLYHHIIPPRTSLRTQRSAVEVRSRSCGIRTTSIYRALPALLAPYTEIHQTEPRYKRPKTYYKTPEICLGARPVQLEGSTMVSGKLIFLTPVSTLALCARKLRVTSAFPAVYLHIPSWPWPRVLLMCMFMSQNESNIQ